MALFLESRAGQNETASWAKQATTKDGQERRGVFEDIEFWCAPTAAEKTTRSFRDGLESKQYSVIIVSTNVSKLVGIQEGAHVTYKGGRRTVVSADYDSKRKLWTLALS